MHASGCAPASTRLRQSLMSGGTAARATEDASERTFKALAERYIARHETSWKND